MKKGFILFNDIPNAIFYILSIRLILTLAQIMTVSFFRTSIKRLIRVREKGLQHLDRS